MLVAVLTYLTVLVVAALSCGFIALRLSVPKWPNKFTIAFFHPYWYVHIEV